MSTLEMTTILRELAAMCRQGERGYAAAAATVRPGDIRQALDRLGRQRGRLAGELEQVAARLSVAEPSAAVRLFGAWPDATRLGNQDESAVLADCIRSEGITRDRFERALEQDLPLNVKMVVLRQYAELKAALDWLRRSEIAASAREHALPS
jgi:uncharacterized protein (TIGR02284 family)